MKTQTISLTELVDKKYVLDNEDLVRLATLHMSTADTLLSLRQAYLRVLLAGTQMALGLSAPRQTGVRSPSTLNEEERSAQLKALNSVHAQYYSVISASVTTPDISDSNRLGEAERHRRAIERNRRTNYARTAKHALKATAAVGYDLRELNVMTVSKSQLSGMVVQRSLRAAPVQLATTQRLMTIAQRFVAEAKSLAENDPARANEAINAAMEQLGALAIDLGLRPARRLDIGVKEHRPVQLKEGMFWPLTQTAHEPAVSVQ